MSLAARCPHCTTLFRLTAPQLSAAGGWVRCGVCSQVFEASAHLCAPDGTRLDIPELAPPQETAAGEAAPPSGLQPLPDIDLELPDLGAFTTPPQESAGPQDALQDVPQSTPLDGAPAEQQPITQPITQPTAQPTPQPPSLEEASPAKALDEVAPPLMAANAVQPPAEPAPLEVPGPGSEWAKPSSPAASSAWAGTLMLTLVAVLLALYAARGHIALAWPQARPLIVQACQALGCGMPARRSLEGLSVEASSLSLDGDQALHRLRVTFRNSSDLPVQVPALDLTLLDADAQVMARRALMPQEVAPDTAAVQAMGTVEVRVNLDLRALDASAISSFRLEPFHP